MSGGNNNQDSFMNLLGGSWNNPNAGSSSNPNDDSSPPIWGNPNKLGLSSEEMYAQHQTLQYWKESQQSNLNSNFQNLQFSQHSQHSQTETNEVPETPASPQKPKSRGKRKAKKSKEHVEENDAEKAKEHWTPLEERLLAKCWVACSEDPKFGRSQSKDTLWQRILAGFNRINPKDRNKDMLQGKWKTLNRGCNKFNACYKKAQRDVKSGESEVDILTRANLLYRQENPPFTNEEAWSVLRTHRKWDVPVAVDLTGDVPSQTNEDLFGHDAEPRPIGKKWATKKQKSETTTTTGGTTSTSGSFSSINFSEMMREELRAKREEASRAYQATAENQAAQQRMKELEFLMLDTNGKDPHWVAFVNAEKDRIAMKLGLPPRQL